jgi:hypothetical protein
MKQIEEKYPFPMDEWSKKFPKSTELLNEFAKGKYKTSLYCFGFNELFGLLILEFFPKHGIEIERKIEYDKYGNMYIKYYVYENGKLNDIFYDTPMKVIDKAFEILEKQLEKK